MNKKVSSKLWLHFIFFVFIIILTTNLLLSVIAFTLARLQIIAQNSTNSTISMISFLLISVVTATGLTSIVGKRILRPISELSNATKSVANGDFSIKLNTDCKIPEMKDMLVNFNGMVKELASIETIQNDFVVNVSHEFKSPINAIEGYAMLLQNRDLTEKEMDEYIHTIIDSSRQLSVLCSNILQISKLENKEIIEEKKPFCLDEQIRQALLFYEQAWNNKNIDMDIELDPVRYNGNEGLLMQVWMNLIDNAIKFTPEFGTIKLTLKEVIIENEIQVSISDTGIGMSEDTMKHIFDKFYQADSTRFTEGIGLGLALVDKIIHLCSGKISVESKEGFGSTFMIKLSI